MSAYQAQRKKVDQDHKELTSEVTTLQSQLKSENADSVAERLGEIQVGGSNGKYVILVDINAERKWGAMELASHNYMYSIDTVNSLFDYEQNKDCNNCAKLQIIMPKFI